MIWHMFLVAGLAFAALLVTAIGHTFNYKRDYHIPADVVARTEAARTEELAAHV
jgi:cytochrome o ubiquinol oxidase subunit 1